MTLVCLRTFITVWAVRTCGSEKSDFCQFTARLYSQTYVATMEVLDDASWATFLQFKSVVNSPPTDVPLRFKVGDAVRAHTGPNQGAAAVVVGLWWRQPQWPPSFFAPYQLRLADGSLIFASVDADSYIISSVGAPPAEGTLDDDPAMALGWPAGSAKAKLEQKGYTPLHSCCAPRVTSGEAELRQLLSRPLIHPDSKQNTRSETPLHIAVQYVRLECVKLLLAAGADPRERNLGGQSALDLANVAAANESHSPYPGAGPQDAMHIRLLLGRGVAELGAAEEEEDDEEEEGWEDMDSDEDGADAGPSKTIRKGRLNRAPRKAKR